MTTRHRNRFRLLQVQKNTLIVYIIVIIIPFIIAISILIYKTSNEVQSSKVESIKQLNEQLSSNIDIVMADINRSSYLNALFYNIEPILKKSTNKTEESYVDDLKTMNDIVKYSVTLNPYINGMTIIGKNGMIFSNTRQTQESHEQLNEFINEARISGKNKYLSQVYKFEVLGKTEKKLITLTRLILDTGFYSEIGSVSIDINYDSLIKVFDLASGNNTDINLVIAQSNNIIYQSMPKNIANYFSEEDNTKLLSIINSSSSTDGIIFNTNGKQYLVFYSVNKDTGWTIIRCLSMDTIKNNIYSSVKFIISVLVIILLFTISTGYYLSLQMSKPINKLHKAMNEIEKSNKIVTIDKYTERRDEIGELICSFNRMSLKLKDSIEKEYLSRIHSRQAEIKMLQAQINPHFLYNTLNLIYSLANINDMDDISSVALNLSHLFRYSIKGKSIVTIKEEIEQVNNYVQIQQLRFPNKIHIKYDIDEDVLENRILKFLIQPLVENCVYHGIEQKEKEGHIEIRIKKENSNINIFIIDDGIGMDKEKLKLLNEQLTQENGLCNIEEESDSVGIKNVHYRINSYYGSDYGLFVSQNDSWGISVKLVIPAIKGDA